MKRTYSRCVAMIGVGVISVGLAAIAGCVSPPSGVEMAEGVEQSDVPLLPNFEFVRGESYEPAVGEGGHFRSWVGYYRGGGHMSDVGPRFVGAMKKNGWRLVGAYKTEGETHNYQFVKGEETAEVTISRKFDFAYGKSFNEIRSRIGPRGTESFSIADINSLKAPAAEPGAQPEIAPPAAVSPEADIRDLTLSEDEIGSPAPASVRLEENEEPIQY